MTVGSLFAGVGGLDLGFERAGFNVLWQVEQDRKAQAVLGSHFPDAFLYDDVKTVGAADLDPVDVIRGGFPCQDVSVAGKREGLGGERTGLFWEVVRIAREMKPRWMVLENVPGLLTSRRGRDFHAVLSALAELGFRRAYRILDSRYFGVAQRRRRVFIVLRAGGSGYGPETVLFESTSGGWDSPTCGEARAGIAATLGGRSHGAGVNMPGRGGEDDLNLIAFDTTQITSRENRSNPQPGGPCHPLSSSAHAPAVAYTVRDNGRNTSQGPGNYVAFTLPSVHRGVGNGHNTNYIAGCLGGGNFGTGRRSEDDPNLVLAGALTSSMDKRHDPDTDTLVAGALGSNKERGGWRLGPDEVAGNQAVASHGGVRRLTPLECERLQGFPDGWTCLCGKGHLGSAFCECADSPRYRQLGNAVTVSVAEWIARRIARANFSD